METTSASALVLINICLDQGPVYHGPVSGTELVKLFMTTIKSVSSYVNDMTFGKYRIRAGCPRTRPCVRGLELLVPPLSPLPHTREGKGLEADSVTNGHWFNQSRLSEEPLQNTKQDRVQRTMGWWTHGDSGRIVLSKWACKLCSPF